MVKAVPEGLRTLTPALNINGAAEAIELYKKAFGAREEARAMDPSGKKVWHAVLRIGDSAVFVNDAQPEMGTAANPSRLWIYQDNMDAAFARATQAGLTVQMPPADMFWGDRMGVVADKFGNVWVLAQHLKDMTPQEMQAAQDAFVKQMQAGKS